MTLQPVTFRFPGSLAPGAKRVGVVGPFNGWNPTVHLLVRAMSGDWSIRVYLPAGRVIYCFDVDGTSWLDPNADGRIPNAWGGRVFRPSRYRSEVMRFPLGPAD